MNLVDNIEESSDVFLKLAAGVVVLCPKPLAIAVAPRSLLFARDARVGASTEGQPVAGEVGPDPRQGARPPGESRPNNNSSTRSATEE